MTVDDAIKRFSEFLNVSFEMASLTFVHEKHLLNDWLQANWELLVEQTVLKPNEFLDVYGDGGDANGSSSRIIDPEALPNFKISLMTQNGKVFDVLNGEDADANTLVFENLVGFRNGFYLLEPDFNYILATDNKAQCERVLLIDDIEFVLTPY